MEDEKAKKQNSITQDIMLEMKSRSVSYPGYPAVAILSASCLSIKASLALFMCIVLCEEIHYFLIIEYKYFMLINIVFLSP